jgi:uncharacterized protein DUF3105
MPRSKKRVKKGSGKSRGYGGHVGRVSTATNLKVTLVVLLLAAGVGVYYWQARQDQAQDIDAFAALAQAGQPALKRMLTPPPQGDEHLAPGETKVYVEPFPTSGDHAGQGIRAGFYDRELPKVNLVHALEHGNVVIYYDTPGDAAISRLRQWAGQFTGNWDGLVVTRSPGLGEALMLTAWTRSLRMNEFDPAGAAAFIDAFRGRGPENRVR